MRRRGALLLHRSWWQLALAIGGLLIAALRTPPAPVALPAAVQLPMELVVDTAVALASAAKGAALVCEEPSSTGFPGAPRGRYLAAEACEAAVLGTARWGDGRFEYFPGSPLAAATSHWRVGVVTAATAAHLRALGKYFASRVDWCEAWHTPMLVYVGGARELALRVVNASALGQWWRQRHELYPSSPMFDAWAKPLAVLHAVKSSRFDFVLAVDADVWVGNARVPPDAMVPASAAAHVVVPRRLETQYRFSNWLFLVRAGKQAEAFLARWLGDGPCDCWVDQGTLRAASAKCVRSLAFAQAPCGLRFCMPSASRMRATSCGRRGHVGSPSPACGAPAASKRTPVHAPRPWTSHARRTARTRAR